jgi:hypothetical protein
MQDGNPEHRFRCRQDSKIRFVFPKRAHLNPARAGLLKPDERLLAFPWSSFGYYLAAPEHRPHWIRVDRLLGEHGLQQDSPAARQEFERRTEARRLEPGDEEALKALCRGWCLGSGEFKQQKLEELDGQVGQHHFGQMRLEVAQANCLSEELRRLGWKEADLVSRRKSDPTMTGSPISHFLSTRSPTPQHLRADPKGQFAKPLDSILQRVSHSVEWGKIGRRLRAETTMAWAWIARKLSPGAPGSLANRPRNEPRP